MIFSEQIALASYIHPGVGKDLWTRIIEAPTDKVSVLVANVLNGPDAVVNTDWKSVIDRAVAKGKIVIGYVRTGYLGVSKQKFQTMLGSTALEDWVAQIEADVEMWYKFVNPIAYPVDA
jgi:Spherulation-specific family 4